MIDPIKIREAKQRQESSVSILGKGIAASKALLWFQEYTKSGPRNVIELKVDVTARSTPNAEFASAFVRTAAEMFEKQILDKAIELAQIQFDIAEKLNNAD